MDIAALSVSSSLAQVQNTAGILIMKKAMDNLQTDGQALLAGLQTTATQPALPYLGTNVDISI